ncbi:GNAT family N-acetyltransferase [Catellatospora bangladeshensis]|uniref:GNAT family acetyltransferase n=1 Tax=Catellatospora bangladeshensis TaxID=310355 RepID=A0A8J3JT66_9ACTN|nr:GNAT family N-acetyltransferase [Catellatospora bangladeshensis]GIF83329.1 GNAT family acetyltransferase [Catellatospora bangladeshensis]
MSDLEIRRAAAADVPVIVAMLADDPLGATREGDPGDPAYARAFAEIEGDPHQLLAVAVRDGEVVGVLQLTVIPGLSRRGMRRALIEAVRVRADQRGQGTGRQLVTWAIDTARERGCGLVQLTTDRSRADAHRFYESLGFVGSHLGMKLAL